MRIRKAKRHVTVTNKGRKTARLQKGTRGKSVSFRRK